MCSPQLGGVTSEWPGWEKGGRWPRLCVPALPLPLHVSLDRPSLRSEAGRPLQALAPHSEFTLLFFWIFVSEQLPALPPESLLLLLLPHLASVGGTRHPSPQLSGTFRLPAPGDLQGRGPAPPSVLSASASALHWGVGSSLTLERFSWFPRAQASPSRPVRFLLTCRVPAGKDGARSPGPRGERAAGR